MATFVFFHVGPDITMPTAMVASIAAHNPGAEIIQVTDFDTPTVPKVTWAHPTRGDATRLMLWRTMAYAQLGLDIPALYMDTDMLVRKPILPADLLGDADIAVCRRTFNRDGIFTPRQRGQDYSEYTNRTLDSVYPYVGCATITASYRQWDDMAALYQALPDKFKVWYGDQEVLREYAQPPRKVVHLPESQYGCLPENLPEFPHPAIVHYKGQRKALMFTTPTPA